MYNKIIIYTALVLIGILLDELVRHTGIRMLAVSVKPEQGKKEAVSRVVAEGAIEYLSKIKAISEAADEDFEMIALSASNAIISSVNEDIGERVHVCIEDCLNKLYADRG